MTLRFVSALAVRGAGGCSARAGRPRGGHRGEVTGHSIRAPGSPGSGRLNVRGCQQAPPQLCWDRPTVEGVTAAARCRFTGAFRTSHPTRQAFSSLVSWGRGGTETGERCERPGAAETKATRPGVGGGGVPTAEM